MAAVSEDAKIRELSELIRNRCAVAQQMKQTFHSGTSSIQLAQAEETRRKLKDAIVYLQEEAQDSSVSGVQQRLQFSAQKVNLSFELQRSQTTHVVSVFLSCEAYYVEVCLEENGTVQSVRLVHSQGSLQEDSGTLTNLLRTYKYALFDRHLKALTDMYSQAPSQEREKLVQVLSATEQVFLTVAGVAQHTGNRIMLYERIMLDPLGLVTPRNAGLPLKLTFFLLPADLVHQADLFTSTGSTAQNVTDSIGVSADVLVERSAQLYRLSVDANLFDRVQGSFHAPQSTVAVPLTLVLVLSMKLPVCGTVMNQLHQAVYGAESNVQHLTGPHIGHLLLTEKGLAADTTKERHHHVVCLPGEVHHYDIAISATPPPHARGVLLPHSKVPFLHPAQVTTIVSLLRQQLLYNVLLSSCFTRISRKFGSSMKGDNNEIHWSINSCPPESVSASTDLMSSNGSLSLTVKFIIAADKTPPLSVYVCVGEGEGQYSVHFTQVVSRCLSIPVTLRAALGHPSLLGTIAATCIQQHYRMLNQFEADIATALPTMNGRHTHPTSVGIKRQRTDT